jgi:hypothetical protein
MIEQPKQIPLTPEVQGYIQGLKDIVAVQSEMISQRSAEIFGLRARFEELLKQFEEYRMLHPQDDPSRE